MPALRAGPALRCVRNLPARPSTAVPLAVRTFSSTARRRGGGGSHGDGHGESPYDPPTGWLWGEKPGTKYKKEGWEGPVYFGFGGAFLLMVIGAIFKPDTS